MQKVASGFFDKGQFWERKWDLYYIHAPSRLGGNPLVLVPASQVRKLFLDINKALDCSLSLPSDEDRGLVLSFNRDGFPQPTFLGHSDSRDTKDRLEARIPRASMVKVKTSGMDEEYMAFEKMMEAAVSAKKSKSKSKAKRQQLRVQRDIDTSDAIKRSQCYLGLRAEDSDVIDCKWDEMPDLESSSVTVDHPAPHSFWKDVVFISVDVEVNERCQNQVTEIGISTLDTRDLAGVAPGHHGENWQSRIKSRHLRVLEWKNHVNNLYVRGCPDRFEFGTSEWVSSDDISKAVQKCISLPSFFDKPRPLVLVGHGLAADIKYLQLANVHIIDDNGLSKFADRIDTAALYQLIRGKAEPQSLGAVICDLGMTGWNLHNAGNDARYTMQALVGMLVMHSVDGPVPNAGKDEPAEAAHHVCVETG
ncbi:hypothetical protein BDV18DRAFT_56088 [Aspergillus unguis]